MKHGDKAKGKASKASKTSGKKVSDAGAVKSKSSESKGASAKASSKVEKSAAKAEAPAGKGAGVKAGSRAPEGNGSRARPANGDGSFGNAIIAAAFKRAAKKYSNAFRRLTD